jgi:hypothetical protein
MLNEVNKGVKPAASGVVVAEGRKIIENVLYTSLKNTEVLQKEVFDPEKIKTYTSGEKIDLYQLFFNNSVKLLEFMRKSSMQELPEEHSALLRSLMALSQDELGELSKLYSERQAKRTA